MASYALPYTFSDVKVCPLCEMHLDGPIYLFSTRPYIRIPWKESIWDVTRCFPFDWNGSMKSLIFYLHNAHNSLMIADDKNNFILYGVVLLMMLWNERNSILHERKEKELPIFVNVVDNIFTEYMLSYPNVEISLDAN